MLVKPLRHTGAAGGDFWGMYRLLLVGQVNPGVQMKYIYNLDRRRFDKTL